MRITPKRVLMLVGIGLLLAAATSLALGKSVV